MFLRASARVMQQLQKFDTRILLDLKCPLVRFLSLSGRAGALLLPSPLRTGLTRFPSIRLKQVSVAVVVQDGFVGGTRNEPIEGWSTCLCHHLFWEFYDVCGFLLH